MYAVCWDLCCRAFVDSAYKLSMIEYHAVLFRVSSTRQCFNSNAQPDVLGMKSERQKSELRMLRIIMQYIRGNVFGQVYLAMNGGSSGESQQEAGGPKPNNYIATPDRGCNSCGRATQNLLSLRQQLSPEP